MGKVKETSLDLRQQVVDLKKKELLGYKSIAKKLNMPISTVRSIVKKYEATGMVENIRRSGRPQKRPDGVELYLKTLVRKEKNTPADRTDGEQCSLAGVSPVAQEEIVKENLQTSSTKLLQKPSLKKKTQKRKRISKAMC